MDDTILRGIDTLSALLKSSAHPEKGSTLLGKNFSRVNEQKGIHSFLIEWTPLQKWLGLQ